jgi:hypothetical protein
MSKFKYNIRDKNGQFTHNTPIISGRLYSFAGVTVRAFGKANGKRLVVYHKVLSGFVNDEDLKPITKEQVEAYLFQP